MKRKLFGLALVLGITALASWTTPSVSAEPLLPCTGRVCLGSWNANMQCVCLQAPNRVITCAAFFQGGCTAP